MKQNAKDYLVEFASSQNDWLKALIYEAIETNGSIPDKRKNEIFTALKNSSNIESVIPTSSQTSIENEIKVTKLIHKNGVNALINNQTIKFSNHITILYGMNGTGKSSYFKILNELAGGNQKKEILPNIYSETPSDIDVEISYQETGGTANTINWDGKTRSLSLLNKCKVFDTSYLSGLLEIRESDSTLINPFGLNLFTYLVELLDTFKQKLSDEANRKKLEKPNINLTQLSTNIQEIFTNHLFTKEEKENIEKLLNFSDEDSKKLEEINKEIKHLKQVNGLHPQNWSDKKNRI